MQNNLNKFENNDFQQRNKEEHIVSFKNKIQKMMPFLTIGEINEYIENYQDNITVYGFDIKEEKEKILVYFMKKQSYLNKIINEIEQKSCFHHQNEHNLQIKTNLQQDIDNKLEDKKMENQQSNIQQNGANENDNQNLNQNQTLQKNIQEQQKNKIPKTNEQRQKKVNQILKEAQEEYKQKNKFQFEQQQIQVFRESKVTKALEKYVYQQKIAANNNALNEGFEAVKNKIIETLQFLQKKQEEKQSISQENSYLPLQDQAVIFDTNGDFFCQCKRGSEKHNRLIQILKYLFTKILPFDLSDVNEDFYVFSIKQKIIDMFIKDLKNDKEENELNDFVIDKINNFIWFYQEQFKFI
ncbi:hypothetical protein PPERSA_01760 [Pseudocohnilembus persalinus]|uniref:Uncharacterized protein n=1 Tax=Pseudocohnilembus persalinus TaxID=266149 RepID=A0A0V0R1D6_PSEPJ|nr:hypothetical protein PPERSA_01760 [Pseudocohnilembus persalinus]|eukprot:KRX08299.1 hypothetical protein PPERSA_01760 [Pseudocohnilembus persalinus]